MDNESDAWLDRPCVLLDGQQVLAEIRSFEESLAELGAEGEVRRKFLLEARGIEVGHASPTVQPLAAASGGAKGGRSCSQGDKGLGSEELVGGMDHIAERVFTGVVLHATGEIDIGAGGTWEVLCAGIASKLLRVAGIGVVELQAHVRRLRVANGDESAEGGARNLIDLDAEIVDPGDILGERPDAADAQINS